jgi:hypothetical protein
MCLTLVAVAQPLFTEDMWWHLSMGRAYATTGPWLEADPNLFTAAGPPSPAAWLSSLSLYGVERIAGFQGLRLAHTALVCLILGFAWSSLFKVSGSRAYASSAAALFAAVSAYRLFQLRPDLVSLLGAVLLVWLLVASKSATSRVAVREAAADPEAAISRSRIVASVLLMGVWANGHAGFALGPILIAASIGGLLLARIVGAPFQAEPVGRMRGLSIALVLGLLATFVNPTGAAPHLLYFSAGTATPELSLVADEWTRIDLFAAPPANLPPSWLSWAIVWCLLAITPIAVALVLRKTRSGADDSKGETEALGIDPALAGVAAVSLVGMLVAVRFLWLGIFPLLLIGHCARVLGLFRLPQRPVHVIGGALFSLFLVYGFYAHGAWPMISKAVRLETYTRPYTAAKNDAHAVWFLRDSELEGNLFNDYWSGNFLGYWLAPGLRCFVNGSLNVPIEVMDAGFEIKRRAFHSEFSFEDLLDRHDIDVFFATGTPRLSLPGRAVISTTTHLEDTSGWLLVFRSLSSAVYLRDNQRNHKNLARVRQYYADAGVPFGRDDAGLDVAQVIREAPAWATEHGLIPSNFASWKTATRVRDPTRRSIAKERLAGLYATLSLYRRAEAIDRETLRANPRALRAARRLVWSLFHQRRFDEAQAIAAQLSTFAPAGDAISRMLVDAARLLPTLSENRRVALVAVLPAMSRAQLAQVGTDFVEPDVR